MSKDVKSADTLSLALEELTKKKNILSEVEYNSARAELISEAKAAITNAKAMVALAQAKQMAVKLQNTGQ
ncbi:MAG: hypothetical protein LBG52_04175 [Candidatus Peribacteria bacterium]|jgi:hypothetical protein|nr:hypothetical protein [Candidatus Peribacteria bacterium]